MNESVTTIYGNNIMMTRFCAAIESVHKDVWASDQKLLESTFNSFNSIKITFFSYFKNRIPNPFPHYKNALEKLGMENEIDHAKACLEVSFSAAQKISRLKNGKPDFQKHTLEERTEIKNDIQNLDTLFLQGNGPNGEVLKQLKIKAFFEMLCFIEAEYQKQANPNIRQDNAYDIYNKLISFMNSVSDDTFQKTALLLFSDINSDTYFETLEADVVSQLTKEDIARLESFAVLANQYTKKPERERSVISGPNKYVLSQNETTGQNIVGQEIRNTTEVNNRSITTTTTRDALNGFFARYDAGEIKKEAEKTEKTNESFSQDTSPKDKPFENKTSSLLVDALNKFFAAYDAGQIAKETEKTEKTDETFSHTSPKPNPNS